MVIQNERAVGFDCQGDTLLGILHSATQPATTGVLFIVGGPQYRVGSHRQFVLMARRFAAKGFSVFRFDYRGMGDSDGAPRDFVDIAEDVDCAAQAFLKNESALQRLVVFGLCDGASAALMYPRNEKIQGRLLLNPWAVNDAGLVRRKLRHYYLPRLLSRSFWSRFFDRKVAFGQVLTDFRNIAHRESEATSGDPPMDTQSDFVARMRSSAIAAPLPTLVLASEEDLTTKAFLELRNNDPVWNDVMTHPEWSEQIVPGADHTLSSLEHLEKATGVAVDWLRKTFVA